VQIKVGDVFVNTWGYEQTNADFYQVVGVTPKTVIVREIENQERETGFMSGYAEPVKDGFKGPEQRKKPYEWSGRTYLPAKHGSCELWDGRPVPVSWYG
jgi:hypothetical protein